MNCLWIQFAGLHVPLKMGARLALGFNVESIMHVSICILKGSYIYLGVVIA